MYAQLRPAGQSQLWGNDRLRRDRQRDLLGPVVALQLQHILAKAVEVPAVKALAAEPAYPWRACVRCAGSNTIVVFFSMRTRTTSKTYNPLTLNSW